MLRTEIIDAYLVAFALANPRSVPPKIEYTRGWFVLQYDGVVNSINRYRRPEIIRMTAQLDARVKEIG